jgi:hypothetical protein
MKVDASSADDMPAFAGLRRSMGAFEQVFCSSLRPLPRIRWGWTWEWRLAFPDRTGILNEKSRKDQILSELPSLREDMCPAVRKIKWLRK